MSDEQVKGRVGTTHGHPDCCIAILAYEHLWNIFESRKDAKSFPGRGTTIPQSSVIVIVSSDFSEGSNRLVIASKAEPYNVA